MAKSATSIEVEILGMMALSCPLQDILSALLEELNSLCPGLQGMVLLQDSNRQQLSHCPGSLLPEAFVQRLEAVLHSSYPCFFKRVVDLGEPTVVTDIAADGRWGAEKVLALQYGLRACWAIPIYASASETILGLLVFWSPTPTSPTPEEWEWVELATLLAAMSIERNRHEEDLRQAEQRYRDLLQLMQGVIWELELDHDHLTYRNATEAKCLGSPQEQANIFEPDRAMVTAKRTEALLLGKPQDYEYRVIDPNGNIVWMREWLTGKPSPKTENGLPGAHFGAVRGWAIHLTNHPLSTTAS